VECEGKSDTGKKRRICIHLKITQTALEQLIRKAGNQRTEKAFTLDTVDTPRKVQILKYITYYTCETTLHVEQIADTTQIQHYIPWEHGLFQVYNCKYIA
jgi:hypothetical protein